MNPGLLFDHPSPPPETTDYMILGYAVIFGIMGLHILSMYLRYRNLNLDLELLEDMEKEG